MSETETETESEPEIVSRKQTDPQKASKKVTGTKRDRSEITSDSEEHIQDPDDEWEQSEWMRRKEGKSRRTSSASKTKQNSGRKGMGGAKGYDYSQLVYAEGEEATIPSFHNPDHDFKCTSYINRDVRVWKSLKQYTSLAGFDFYPPEQTNFARIVAQPSAYPHKRYCDVTGLPSSYTEPSTKLFYAHHCLYPVVSNFDEFHVRHVLEKRGSYQELL